MRYARGLRRRQATGLIILFVFYLLNFLPGCHVLK